MAEMKVKIVNPEMDVMRNVRTTTTNCEKIYEFEIHGTPNGQVKVDLTRLTPTVEDYYSAQINTKGLWFNSNHPTHTHTLRGTGKATFKLVIKNADLAVIKHGQGTCNKTEVKVTDLTTNVTESQVFTNCKEGACSSETPSETPELTIENDTNVYIYFDSSSSMDETLPPLQTMRDTLLKDALLPYYDNNETTYNSRVKVYQEPNERTLQMLNIMGQTPASGKIIALVFQDESEPDYHNPQYWSINDTRKTGFDTDLATLRGRLNSYAENHYRGVLFHVKSFDFEAGGYTDHFKALFKAVKYGSGQYSGTNGLSDRNEFNYKFDVTNGGTPEYYKDLIINALEELGFTI
jgi:hypothetical protein